MRLHANKRRRAQQGFSLIELMVVITIMGLLATAVLLSLAPVGDKSRVTKARSDIASLETAIEIYSLDMATYPTGEAGLNALTAPPADAGAPARAGGYIKRLQDDPWGKPYEYVAPGVRSNSAYDVFSAGPDGQPGNADDIGNW